MNDSVHVGSNSSQILVVDDTPASLKLLTEILTHNGYHVRPAINGKLALRTVEAELPDLILLDVLMPDMDGYEICKILKNNARTRGIPVIFISSLEQPADRVKGFQVGAVDFISKPIDPPEMLSRIHTHLSLRHLQNLLEAQNLRLEEEIIEREQKEDELQQYKESLEITVLERTEKIQEINRKLELHNIILATQQESSIDGILTVDESGNILSINRRFKEIFTLPLDCAISRFDILIIEYLKKNFSSISTDIQEILSLENQSDTCNPEEYSLVDGRTIELYSSPMIGIEGTHFGKVWFFRDITKRKNMENMLREKTDELDRFFSLNLDLLCIASDEGYFIRLNPEWEHVLGYSLECLMSKQYIDFVHPDDLDITRKKADISREERLFRFTNRYRHKDGTYRWIEWNSVPYKNLIYASARDITDRIYAEQGLRESEEKYHTVADFTYDWELWLGPDRQILYCSPACERITGYPLEEFIADPLLLTKIIHPDDLIRMEEHNHTAWEAQEAGSIDFRIIHRNGTVLWIGHTCQLVTAPDGTTLGRRISNRDITEQKQAEKELARMNRALRMLSDSNQALIHIMDEAMLMNEICRIAVDVGGYRMAWIGFAEQDEAKTLRPVAHAGYESGYLMSANVTWADSKRGRGPCGTAIRTGQPSVARNIPVDPAFAPWRVEAMKRGYQSIIALPLTSDGRTFGAMGIYSSEAGLFDTGEFNILTELADNLAFGITVLRTRAQRELAEEALRENEKRLIMAQEIGHTGSWEYNVQTGKLWRSAEGARIIGIQKGTSDFSMEQIEAGIPERERVHQALVDLIEHDKEYNLEFAINPADGSAPKVIFSMARLEKDASGNPLRVIGVIQDITERRKTENELIQYQDHLEELIKERTIDLQIAKDQAEKANLAKSNFLSSMSHELRTPLNAILGFTQILLRQENLSDTQREQLQIVGSSGEHLLSLINDLLDLGRIEAHKMELQQLAFNLPDAIRDVINFTKVKAEEKDLTFQCEPQILLPDHVFGDERKIKQILLNLLNNAVKYTQEGGIILRAWYPDISTGVFVGEVEDSGIGISQDKLEIIFEPFSNLSSERKPIEGAGLGLSITKNLVEMMQGTLEVKSEPGKGSVFRFEVVLPPVEVSEARQTAEDQITGYKGERKRVLVVDDNPANVALLVSILEPLGFEMTTAYNGNEAVRLARDKIPDLILLDLVMPEMDGLDVARIFRNHPDIKQIPIIGVSASVSPSERRKEFELVCDGFLSKPIPFDELLEKIRISLGIFWDVIPAPSEPQSPGESAEGERTMVVPPEQTLQIIISLVKRGMFSELKPILTVLQDDGRYTSFCEQIFRFARNYDDERILSFIAGMREKENHEG